ncbi:M15 family metallopeptidase [Psychrobacillus sp. MER TA 171]|uniref:M15 family metallopeptidase n=1 Tax=Psychrobacillus sp. MER TA 171 TaxID=2939577 RepID=UPI00203EBAB5|nr:M15 family metallopeptidase [Psychrobacillus sp. MER TA 171]MCM3357165.1 M15 family metallopeptidase [Psychrobacillus sp. MER TA 171]
MKKFFLLCCLSTFGFFIFTNYTNEDRQIFTIEEEQIYVGNLILINNEVKLQKEPTEIIAVPNNFANNVEIQSEITVHKDLLTPMQDMFKAAEKDGMIHFKLNSGFRTGIDQQKLYEELGSQYALPAGYSEHQSGLSIDIGSTEGMMEYTLEAEWLAQHAPEFGFILRYPENKVEVTGIAFEPWHFRYVGKPHSLIMTKEDLVLEEYLAFIKEKGEYETTIEGKHYQIRYVKPEQLKIMELLKTNQDEISGDNLGGIIITKVID